MKLNKREIKELKRIYKKEFNQEIDDAMVQKVAKRYLLLFKVVYGIPISKEHNKYEQ